MQASGQKQGVLGKRKGSEIGTGRVCRQERTTNRGGQWVIDLSLGHLGGPWRGRVGGQKSPVVRLTEEDWVCWLGSSREPRANKYGKRRGAEGEGGGRYSWPCGWLAVLWLTACVAQPHPELGQLALGSCFCLF